MSTLMHYIWRNRMLPKRELRTTKGEEIKIIETGKSCSQESNIFRNARLRIGEREWSGNIIIHHKSSDWEKDIQSNKNSSYKNIILHITESDDIETMLPHGEYIPQLRITFPASIAQEYDSYVKGEKLIPCHQTMASMEKMPLHGHLSRLLVERIDEKAERIEALYNECDKRWEETLFKLLARNFGFGVQSAAFEEWASMLNLQALAKHRNNLLQVEAVFFGQAGLLDPDSIPAYYRNEALETPYYKELNREYKFLSTKFALKAMNAKAWSTTAPPHLRIARLASLYSSSKATLSAIASCETIDEIEKILQVTPQGYWWNHLQFGGTTTTGSTPLRKSQMNIIIINTIAPMLYTYGKHRNDATLCNKAEDILHTLETEHNSIIKRWASLGVTAECAADSQALIQLQKSYCNKHACENCRFAYAHIKQRINKN